MQKSKVNTLKQQRESAELELIIEEFGRAMRNANKTYMTIPYACGQHGPKFTLAMEMAWNRYTAFCEEHQDEKS